MMRSMFSGVSGLKVHQTKMDVIANNISNVNTVGFKASRVTFNEVFSQTLSGASSANDLTGRGGTNPMQIGLGASVSSIDKIMTTGAAQRTDNPWDVMIQGEGFLIVGDSSGTYFTRAGALNIDLEGNLVNGSGLKVYGWDAVPDTANPGSYKISKGKAEPISITGQKERMDAQATKNVKLDGNLNATIDGTEGIERSISIYDSVGNRYVLDMKMVYVPPVFTTATPPVMTAAAYWTTEISNLAYPNGDPSLTPVVIDDTLTSLNLKPADAGSGTAPAPYATVNLNLLPYSSTTPAPQKWIPLTNCNFAFGTNAKIDTSKTGNGLGYIFTVKNNGATTPDSVFGDSAGGTIPNGQQPILANSIRLDLSEVVQYSSENSTVKATTKDGNAPGTLNGLSVGPDGKIMGRYSNGQLKLLGQIPVAVFKNPAGLEKIGDNLFAATSNSGDFDGVGSEVASTGGKMMGGVLEMANVDLGSEFTEMITTQRGFQANSRVISTSDDMLQELVNLKR